MLENYNGRHGCNKTKRKKKFQREKRRRTLSFKAYLQLYSLFNHLKNLRKIEKFSNELLFLKFILFFFYWNKKSPKNYK